MESHNQRISKERNERIRKALESKTFVPQKFVNGMSASDILSIMKGKKSAMSPLVHHKTRPHKTIREINTTDLKMLLDTPTYVGRPTVEWPTPEWFRSSEDVDVTVVVPLYNSVHVVDDLIQSWDLDNSGLKVEMVFVDDHCPKDSKSKVVQSWEYRKSQLRHPVGRIYYNQVNQGFGSSCNVGVWNGRGKYAIILNSDTKVTKDWIKPIIRLLRDNVGIVGNMQIKDGGVWDGTIDSAGSEWNWQHKNFLHVGRHILNGQPLVKPINLKDAPPDLHQVNEREMVTGCCMGFERQMFLDLGGFDPNFRIGYWEDSDLCLRFRERGYKVLFQPNSKIYHKLGHTKSGEHKFHNHNQQYFFNKWVNSGRIDPLVKAKRDRKVQVRSILIQRQAARGDVLLAAAVAPALIKKYDCDIVFNTRCREVLEGNPYIAHIVDNKSVSERQCQVILNLDMAYESRPNTNILEAYADAVGVKVEDCELFLKTEPIDVPDDYVVIHAGKTMWAGRDWSQMKFGIIANRLMQYTKVVCVGGENDGKVGCDLDLRGKTNIAQLSHVIKNSKAFIGIDSFPLHVAQAFNVPGVVFFGSISPKTRIYRDNITPVSALVACLGCHHKRQPPCIVTNSCENDTFDCINKLSADEFWNTISVKLGL